MTDHLPPHSEDAERSVLGAILVDNGALVRTGAILTDADFYRDPHRRIFRAMVALAGCGTAIDTVTVKDQLAGDLEAVGGAAYVAALPDGVPHSSNVEHYARIVKEKAVDRAAMVAAQALIDSVHGRNGAGPGEGREGINAAAAACQHAIADLHHAGGAGRTHLEVLDVMNMIENGAPGPVFDLEDLLVRRTLTYLTGAPKGFKTWLALDWAIALATGGSFAGLHTQGVHRVLFIEAESRLQIPERFARLCLGRQVNPAVVLERLRFMVPTTGLRLDDPAQAAYLLRTVKDFGATWVIVDSFVRVHALEENSSADMARLANLALLPLRDQAGCGVLMLDHPPKPWQGAARGRKEQVRGSWEKLAAADSQIHVDVHEVEGRGRVVEVAVAASRVAPEPDDPLFVRLATTPNEGLRFEETDAPAAPPRVGRPATAIEQAINIVRAERGRCPALTFTDAVKACAAANISKRTATRAWKECHVPEVPEQDSALGTGAGKA